MPQVFGRANKAGSFFGFCRLRGIFQIMSVQNPIVQLEIYCPFWRNFHTPDVA